MNDYAACRLCPRACGVDRAAGARGVCGMDGRLRIARAAPHFGEEPPISGTRGSGAVFFSGCSLGCCFCQNEPISHGGFGAPVTADRLRGIFAELAAQGVHNLNLVTATHFLPDVLEALTPQPALPVVWNSGGYETPETLARLSGKVQIYLPDLKYADAALARRLSAAPDYFPVATRAILEMYRQTGPVRFDDAGMLVSGVLIRHLILPGQIENSLRVLDWIGEHFMPGTVLVSLMSQYTPMPGVPAALSRPITREEYDAVLAWMELNGLDGFTQEFSSQTPDYIPDFSLQGVRAPAPPQPII